MAAPENMICIKSRISVELSVNVLLNPFIVEWCFLELWGTNDSVLQNKY